MRLQHLRLTRPPLKRTSWTTTRQPHVQIQKNPGYSQNNSRKFRKIQEKIRGICGGYPNLASYPRTRGGPIGADILGGMGGMESWMGRMDTLEMERIDQVTTPLYPPPCQDHEFPISRKLKDLERGGGCFGTNMSGSDVVLEDRKSTRLNSSHI